MAPPTPLAIATSSVLRLVKEEKSYHRELEEQTKRIQKLEEEIKAGGDDEDGNKEYMLKQEASFHCIFFVHLSVVLDCLLSACFKLKDLIERAWNGSNYLLIATNSSVVRLRKPRLSSQR